MTKRRPTGKPKAKQTTTKKTTTATTAQSAEALATETPPDTTVSAPETATSTAARRAARLNRQQVRTLALEVEYGYVVKDLRRVLLLAALMVVGLVVANLAFTFLGG